MPGEILATYKTDWGAVDYSSKPTEYDSVGRDGIYVHAIRIQSVSYTHLTLPTILLV